MQHQSEPLADDAPEFVQTEDGRRFVEDFRPTDRPAGRATNWHGPAVTALLEPATAALGRGWNILTNQTIR